MQSHGRGLGTQTPEEHSLGPQMLTIPTIQVILKIITYINALGGGRQAIHPARMGGQETTPGKEGGLAVMATTKGLSTLGDTAPRGTKGLYPGVTPAGICRGTFLGGLQKVTTSTCTWPRRWERR